MCLKTVLRGDQLSDLFLLCPNIGCYLKSDFTDQDSFAFWPDTLQRGEEEIEAPPCSAVYCKPQVSLSKKAFTYQSFPFGE